MLNSGEATFSTCLTHQPVSIPKYNFFKLEALKQLSTFQWGSEIYFYDNDAESEIIILKKRKIWYN